MMKIDVIIPTHKPDEKFKRLVEELEKQTLPVNKIIVMNTEEQYFDNFVRGTAFLSDHKELEIHHISKREFDHGRTRNQGAAKSDAQILVFMTHDAIPESHKLIEKLVAPLQDEKTAVSYARQLPAEDCSYMEKVTREFNYPAQSRKKSREDLQTLGIKTYFCSNVCAAYRRDVFDKLGGFINHTIFNEDMIYAANAIKNGYEIAYTAEAEVIHSHNYTCKEQFQRNFDLGVSQADHPEIFENVPSESEGKKMVRSVLKKLKREGHQRDIFPYLMMSAYKLIGYKLGKHYKKLSKDRIRKCTMNQGYWVQKDIYKGNIR